ncbi:hypothetical protein PFNF135_04555 [Plasmodium falciparum NF135/5.C10]|uniref:Uncharacterized protein n=1 Tax=Plasmodium falciparum NF135/5.C10 TaxID=1036726 RepID=W4IBY9_PLAFA|nr:hypothetical protein PFNF135_04555 [Plasmodium falciparum NF135/5.C10]
MKMFIYKLLYVEKKKKKINEEETQIFDNILDSIFILEYYLNFKIYYKIFKRNKFHLSLMRKISLILIKK